MPILPEPDTTSEFSVSSRSSESKPANPITSGDVIRFASITLTRTPTMKIHCMGRTTPGKFTHFSINS
ncbi:UNVERIFIED_CONTAM: hypothetical protein PYX00_003720 [Menopon gallinae]|uniref:Uncharacterized protein n=1 Tax=Menopon gallinae TaxID=328185 RepID=A0AAW2I124_9NEOP